MLAPARAGADRSGLPPTVWPSKWYGRRDFHGGHCLLTFAAAPGATAQDAPRDTADGCATEPLLTVFAPQLLPRGHRRTVMASATPGRMGSGGGTRPGGTPGTGWYLFGPDGSPFGEYMARMPAEAQT